MDICEGSYRGLDAYFEKGIHGENYRIGSGTEYSNIEIVNKICKIYDKLTDNINSQKLISFVKDRKGHDLDIP